MLMDTAAVIARIGHIAHDHAAIQMKCSGIEDTAAAVTCVVSRNGSPFDRQRTGVIDRTAIYGIAACNGA